MSKSLKMIIEALLFSSDKPITVKDINDVLPDAEKSEIKNSITILTHDYDALERSFVLKEVAGGYQFRSRPEYGSYILRMFQKTPNRLSRATIETLAIIAYKQPILRSEIERLRGVDVGGILKTLMEKGLIKIMGRKELPGRPLVYGTTKRFLEVFDLKNLNSLPKLKEIKDFAADQYEPTIMNRGTSDEVGADEEDSLPSDDRSAEVSETEAGAGEMQEEPTESEVNGISESAETEDDADGEGADMAEPEDYADDEVADSAPDSKEIHEEDILRETQEIPAPEDSVEPEDNGTES
jgi:segregation and condensation protein B